MRKQSFKIPLSIAVILLSVGIVYQNCGSINTDSTNPTQKEFSTHGPFLEEKYEGPAEFSPRDQKEETSEKTSKPTTEEASTKDEQPAVVDSKIEASKEEPTKDDERGGVFGTSSGTSARKIDPCRMDTNGNDVIDKNDQKLLHQMMQGGLTPDQIAQFDFNNDGQVNQTEILYYPSHVGEVCKKLKRLAVGEKSTCGISYSGKVYCWSGNEYGQLGNGSAPTTFYPSEIDTSLLGITNKFKDISAGNGYYFCGIHNSGKIYCWGRNLGGQLGDGTTTDHDRPVELNMTGTGFTNDFKSLSAAVDGAGFMEALQTCAIHTSGQGFCWGNNSQGQFGTGNTTSSLVPVAMNMTQFSSSELLSISLGRRHGCAIDSNHKLYCWGTNELGQLGNGTTTNQLSPVEVDVSSLGLSNNFKKVSVGHSTCAIHDNNKAYCWGGNGSWGLVGNGTFDPFFSTPQEVNFASAGYLNQVIDISVGTQSSCAIDINHKGFCWGLNDWGQLGRGIMGGIFNLPLAVEDQPPVYAVFDQLIAAPGRHACGIHHSNGKTYCWVDNSNGQIGVGDTILHSSHPMDLDVDLSNVH